MVSKLGCGVKNSDGAKVYERRKEVELKVQEGCHRLPDLKVSIITPDPSILLADLAIDPSYSATSPTSRRRDNGVFAPTQAPTLVVQVASVAMCDVPSAALECRSQPVEKDVRGREAEGKRSWGARVGAPQACLPTRRHRCQCVIVSWSADEADQYLTAYRQSERRTLTLIYEHLTEAPDALLRTTLTGIESEQDGRRDTSCVIWLLQSFTKIAQADTCLLVFESSGRRTCSRGQHGWRCAPSSLLINGGAWRCVIQALARGEGRPTVGHELNKVATLPAEDEIVQRVVGERHHACAGVKRQWD
ncbi:hypothetical protein EDB86DRAFT_3246019 [Lactarius hatsudake]|nr:hypothetical protein EDB86DRAFT_3246019 [Lactarius hatsudake]